TTAPTGWLVRFLRFVSSCSHTFLLKNKEMRPDSSYKSLPTDILLIPLFILMAFGGFISCNPEYNPNRSDPRDTILSSASPSSASGSPGSEDTLEKDTLLTSPMDHY